MEIRQLHPWNLEPRDAIATQKRLACQVVLEGSPQDVRTVAGADISTAGGRGRGAVVVLSYPELQVLESQVVEAELAFPYIPGLLAFREVPVLAEAFQRLSVRPDLLLVDGQGWPTSVASASPATWGCCSTCRPSAVPSRAWWACTGLWVRRRAAGQSYATGRRSSAWWCARGRG